MIVVDTNVIAYCWIDGERTAVAQRVRSRDPEWHAPFLWRSELRSALVATLWRRAMKTEDASSIMTEVENALTGREHLVASDAVLELAVATHLSAYDCEFVALADALGVPLVTEDRVVLNAFPDRALTMEAFLEAMAPPPGAHGPRAPYAVSRRRRIVRKRA